MLNVLINAYSVGPNWGSELGLGWNWVTNIAKYCNVFVITEGECQDEILEAIESLPQKNNLHFFFNPLPDNVRIMCKNQGDWRFYWYYRKWQNKTLEIAREIIANNKIDIIHQLNMIGYREPGSLWKIEGIPFVWGPVGGYGWTTLKYLTGQPFNVKIKAILKNLINWGQSRFYPLSNRAMKKAAKVLAANSNVYDFIRKHHRDDVILMNETGCYAKDNGIKNVSIDQNTFEILWVGKSDYRKQIDLAVMTVYHLAREFPFVKLNIVGDIDTGTFLRLSSIVQELGIEKNINWCGRIPNKDVHRRMQESDIFLFTSIDEGTPHVVLEAIQNNLPIVCFDTCGHGDVVTENIGVKIPLSNSKKSSCDFAKAIGQLIRDRGLIKAMKQNCNKRQTELTWESKIKQMIEIYESLIQK